MSIRKDYKHTLAAGYISSITQAVINNFTPLLFVTFQEEWGITLGQLAVLATYNFVIQLFTDFIAPYVAEKTSVRAAMSFAHYITAAGFIALGILPYMMDNHYIGIMIASTFYAIGGGFIEVLASPIIQACPTKNKASNMSILHSFYCWGQMSAVLVSTGFFFIFGTTNWRYMSFIWAIIPLFNAIYFSLVPILISRKMRATTKSIVELFRHKVFWIFAVMMICAGASELSIAQWASAFAEESLGISKTAGDIAGPCLFAMMMGISRIFHSKFSKKIKLDRYILFCSVLCVISYLITALAPVPELSLAGCALCGFAVGIMWPGTYSLAAKQLKHTPSTALFAMLALSGDVGCSSGPYLLGSVSDMLGNNLRAGVLAGTVFPVLMVITTIALLKNSKKEKELAANS